MAQSELQRIAGELVAYFEQVTGEVAVLVEIHNATTRNANLLGVLSHQATGTTRSFVGAAALELAEASKAVRSAAEHLEDSRAIALRWARQTVLDSARTAADPGGSAVDGANQGEPAPAAVGTSDPALKTVAGTGGAASPTEPKVAKPPPRDAHGVVQLSTTEAEHQEWLQNPPGDATIVVDGIFTYLTDARGRVITAKATLRKVDTKHPRNNKAQRNLPDRQKGDHAGHIFARIFKGPGELVNLVPMTGGKVNLSSYKIIENQWKNAITDGKEVKVEVRLKYRSEARRPDVLIVDHWIGDTKFSQTIRNRALRKQGDDNGSA